MKYKAFTIIELMLTVVLSAILLVPVVVSVFNHFYVTSESVLRNQLVEIADKARLLSCNLNVPVSINFDRNKQSLILEIKEYNIGNNPVHRTNEVSGEIVSVFRLPSNVKIGKIETPNSKTGEDIIVFYPSGVSEPANVEFNLGESLLSYYFDPYLGLSSSVDSINNTKYLDLDKSETSNDDIFK